jgi:two-component system CheB/CheR fusion protein
MKSSETAQAPKSDINFPIVGIGASAGGLEPFKKLLKQVPVDSGMAYVIVQHLSPDYDSNLTEILSQHSAIPVHEIINEIHLLPNNVYIIPENNNLITIDGVLKLEKRTRATKLNRVIDIFFESLAEVHESFAIGVVLSGTAFDGTMGLKRIKELGGATIAQDPETAAFRSMPQSAIDADAVDHILAPEHIPAKLVEIHNSYEANHAYSEDESIPPGEEELLHQITNLIFLRTGNDFRHYKQPTIRRRVARRMVVTRRDTLKSYCNFVRNDKPEQDALFNDFLIPVTYFFRDDKIFEKLTVDVFPEMVQQAANNSLRIWVAGCSTGEEAYSIAMLLHEFLSDNNITDMRVQVFASDISEKCINKARSGIYSPQDVQNVDERRLNRYFTKRDGNFHINKSIRDMCVFALHNFVKDPPFAKIDFISCRNVMIYLDPYLQNKVLSAFHYALKEKGFLFLGKSETAGNMPNLFEPVDKHEKIYIKKFAAGRYVPEAFKPKAISLEDRNPFIEKKIPETDFRKIASDILFSRYTPAGVVINEHQEIVHFHGDTGPFLLQSPGKPNFNLLKMAREGISFELRNALLKVKEQEETIVKENITVKGQPYLASFEIVTLNSHDNHLMVLFYQTPLPQADENSKLTKKTADQQRIKELERELMQMREDIKRVTEEQQTAYEELQTTNEELLSSSEELQALNEELETSTEELQSNNEELLCVNDELLDRQEQLISLRNYSESIVKTIREPLIIIDQDFNIKSGNPAYYKYFRTTESETEGFSFFEIGNGQWNTPEFKEMLHKVVVEQSNIQDYKIEVFCPGIGKKVMMINARRIITNKPSEMILLAIEDMTELMTTNTRLVKKNLKLEELNEQLQIFSSAAGHDLQEPLHKIQMLCSRIIESEKNLSESNLQYFARVMVAIENMQQLITDLIEFTRASLQETDFKKTNLQAVVKKVMSEMHDTIHDKKAVIEVGALPELPILPYQMKQLFINLVSNAIKYGRDDVPVIVKIGESPASREEIAALGADHELTYAKISVTDNGIGFVQDEAQKIFQPFVRLHSKEKYEGSGLGLALVKKVVSNHGGYITATGSLNQGARFDIYLPLSRDFQDE